MRTLSRLTSLALLAALLIPAAGRASDGIVGQTDLDQAVAERLTVEAVKRQVVRETLSRTEVAKVAEQMGVDLRGASSAVDTLSGEELEQVAARAEAVDQALAGGDTTIEISLVAALLIVIIIILIVD